MAGWCSRIATTKPAGRQADPSLQWDSFVVAPVAGSEAWQAPVRLTETTDNETSPRVSPDGRRVVFVSDRDSTDDVDLWAMPVPAAIGREAGAARGAAAASSACRRRRAIGRRSAVESRPPRVVARDPRARRGVARRRGRPTVSASRSTRCATGVGSVWVAPRRTAATRAERQSRSRGRDRAAPPGSCRGWAERRRGRPTAARCSSPACPTRSRSTTATRCAARASRRRCSRCRARFSCGASRRRCRCTKTAAR